MDTHDIFMKLTRGVHFNRKRSHLSIHKELTTPQILPPVIKEEKEYVSNGMENNQPTDSTENLNNFQIFGDINSQNEPSPSKKHKKNHNINIAKKRKLLQQEELNYLRNSNRISAHGKNIPPPIQTFDELALEYQVPLKLINNLGICGYPMPTPIQMQAIPIMLQGRGLMACAPTGSGKTVAFLTPIIRDLNGPQKKGFRAIILCPTRELAKQTHRECLRLTEKIGLKSHVISKIKQVEEKYGPKSNKKYDILVSTPNRIRFLLQQDPPMLDFSKYVPKIVNLCVPHPHLIWGNILLLFYAYIIVEWFVIDEADKLMEDGQNSFKEQFEDILNACTKPNKKLALFSATYTAPVAKWAVKNMKNLIKVTIGERNSATDLVNQELLFVGSESGKLLAIRDLIRTGLKPPVLVFVQSKDRAKQLFGELIFDGINVDVIHADRTQQQRDNVVRAFREGKIWVLICTELMGRGIDFKGVNLVINYDFPPTAIAYIHRIGRTGRAGRKGNAITFFTQDDTTNLRSIAHIIKNSGGKVPEFMLTLKKMKKSDKKKLENFAPSRDDITTVPKFVLEKRKLIQEAQSKNNEKTDHAKSSINPDHKKRKHKNGKFTDKIDKKKRNKINYNK